MDVRILGPLEVRQDGRSVELAAGRQRTLLAVLAVHANEVVSGDRLVEALWGESPPETAHKSLLNVVSQVRGVIGPSGSEVLVTRSPGYVLELEPGELDSRRFEELAADGRRSLEEEPALAAEKLREALSLWRGDPLADFAYEPFAQVEIARLEELKLDVTVDRVDADLALGRHTELVSELETLVAAHPFDERLRGQLMQALYRCGRQADALDVYRAGRRALREELGLEPGAALRQLEQAILNQDESLGSVSKLPPPPLRTRRRRFVPAVLAAAALIVAAATVTAVLLTRTDDPTPVVVPDSLVKIDPANNEIVDVIRLDKQPGPPLAAVGGYLFVASEEQGTLYRVDMASDVVATSGKLDAAGPIASEADSWLWVMSTGDSNSGRPSVARIAPSDLAAAFVERIGLPRYSEPVEIAVGGGSLWVTEGLPPAVSRWSLRTLRLERRYGLRADSAPLAIGFGDGAAWVADAEHERLLRIDARSGRMRRIPVGGAPVSPVVAFGSVWVQTFFDGAVWRLDPATGKPRAIIRLSKAPLGIAAGAGSLWVTGHCKGVVSRIDPATDSVVATIDIGYHPRVPAVAGGFVWVTVAGEASSPC